MALRRAIEGQTVRAILEELQTVASRLGMIEGALPLQAKVAAIAQQIHEEAERLAENQARQAQAVREGFEKGRETLAQIAYLERRDRSIL